MKLYVGTYAKYNRGSIAGAWLNLDDYANKAEFMKACRRLHRGERDPEFMFQDYEATEDWERHFYDESSIDESYWTVAAEERAKAAKEAAKPSKLNKIRQEWLNAVREVRGDDWVDYYNRKIDVVVKLTDDRYYEIEKPSIKTRHCEGEDDGRGRSIKDAQAGCAYFESEEGFKATNLEESDLSLDWYFDNEYHASNVRIYPHSWGRNDNTPFVRLVDRERHYIECKDALSDLSLEDKRRIERGYEIARANFKKRLDAYWKRWGASKLHTWTYWTED